MATLRPSVRSFVGRFVGRSTRNKMKIPEWESTRGVRSFVRSFVRHPVRPLVRSSDGLQETNEKFQNGKPLQRSRRQSPANATTIAKRAVPPSSSCQRTTHVHIAFTQKNSQSNQSSFFSTFLIQKQQIVDQAHAAVRLNGLGRTDNQKTSALQGSLKEGLGQANKAKFRSGIKYPAIDKQSNILGLGQAQRST